MTTEATILEGIEDLGSAKPRRGRPAGRTNARPPSAEEVFLAGAMGSEEIISRTNLSDGSNVTFTHRGSKIVVLYRPVSWGWESVPVPSANVLMLLQSGMRTNCGDCHGDCSPDPMAPTPNACPARTPFAFRRCPVCGKVVYDFGARIIPEHVQAIKPLDEEGEEIDDGAYALATPEARTKANLDQHILAYHSDNAAELGLNIPDPRLVRPGRSLAEARQGQR